MIKQDYFMKHLMTRISSFSDSNQRTSHNILRVLNSFSNSLTIQYKRLILFMSSFPIKKPSELIHEYTNLKYN